MKNKEGEIARDTVSKLMRGEFNFDSKKKLKKIDQVLIKKNEKKKTQKKQIKNKLNSKNISN